MIVAVFISNLYLLAFLGTGPGMPSLSAVNLG
jgi:hypothetical protein